MSSRLLGERRRARESGYTLVELLVSAAIMITVTGAIFSLMNPAQGSAQVQPEIADMQQRMRVGSEVIFKELVMVGAGPYQGAVTGSLLNYFAPLLPRRGGDTPDAKTVFRSDAITLTYVPNTYSQTTIRDAMPSQAVPIKVDPQPNCPDQQHNALCGFEEGMEVLIFDSTGAYDTFTISSVADEALQLRHQGYTLSTSYESGARITQATRRTIYFDDANQQLRVTSGHDDVPVVDNVVSLKFEYFGDPQPPRAPRPATIGTANCVIDASGNPRLPVLSAVDGGLAALPASILTDGLPEWCGSGTNEYDPDLLRIRKIRVTLRMQAANAALRGGLALDGTTQRYGAGGERYVPDYILTFDITPRNMNLSR
jgi:hypothetical protein